MRQEAQKATETPSDWIEKNFIVPDPRDPVTGELLPLGPIRLSEHQRRIINEALSKDKNGKLKYTTVVYSAPKKSGKSAITSAVILYMAYHNPNSYLACVANDGKQANDRLFGPIYTALRLHRQMNGPLKNESPNIGNVTLSNFTKIEAITSDAAGEAGSQPLMSAFSELWGFETPNKRRLFTELTIPPTLYGRAIRWIESYAGYSGVSELLEQMYATGFENGEPHPDFLDLVGRNGPVVRVNERAGMFTYWDTEPRMPWQTADYYRQESEMLPPSEFRRIHKNEWVSPIESFIQESWWDACVDTNLGPLYDKSTPVVVGIDMAVTRDCAALVAVTRDPFEPDTKVAVRAVRIFSPQDLGGIIQQETMIRPVIEDWAKRWNVVCWVYDPREMSKLAQDLTREGVGWFKAFGQTQPRAVADKALHDMIVNRQISWNPGSTEGDVGYKGSSDQNLYRHLTLAGANTRGDTYRLEKLSSGAKIDGAVALSQAAHTAMSLAIGNSESDVQHLIEQLRRGLISQEQFSLQVRKSNPQLKERG